jgi:hypothetical protein
MYINKWKLNCTLLLDNDIFLVNYIVNLLECMCIKKKESTVCVRISYLKLNYFLTNEVKPLILRNKFTKN